MVSHASIIRTTFESGLKRIEKDVSCSDSDLPGKNISEIISIVQQNDERQRLELVELNSKLGNYVHHVKRLEEQNRLLDEELRSLKDQAVNGIRTAGDGLFRERIDSYRTLLISESQERADILSKGPWNYERIIAELIDQIKFEESLEKMLLDRLRNLTELNDSVSSNLEEISQALDNLGYSKDITSDISSSTYLTQIMEQYEKLRDHFLDKLYEKIISEDLLRSAEEQLAFIRALSEQEYSELDRFGSSNVDARSFYRSELMGSIAGIRKDFEELKRQSVKEFEQYYTAKTEVIRKQVNQERERTTSMISDQETRQSRVMESMNTEMNDLKSDMTVLVRDVNRLSDECYLAEQRYRETQHANEKILDDQQSEITNLEFDLRALDSEMSSVSDRNISLNFEIHTYRRLIEAEELHYEAQDKFDSTQVKYSTSRQYRGETKRATSQESTTADDTEGSSTIYQMSFNVTLPSQDTPDEKEKTPVSDIVIDSLSSDGSVIILANRSKDKTVNVSEWCINQSYSASQKETDNALIYYYLPDNCTIAPHHELKIFSRQSRDIALDLPSDQAIVADSVDAWLKGNAVSTKLIGSDGGIKHFV